MTRRLLASLLALCMALALLPGTAWAAETSGECGDDVRWSYSASSQTLTLTGSGETYAYGGYWFRPPAPWAELADQIKFIHVQGFITGLGNGLFEDCTSAMGVSLPKTLEEIGMSVFPSGKRSALQWFITEENSAKYQAYDNVLYAKSESGKGYDLICYPPAAHKSTYTLRSDTKAISDYGFYYNPNIKTVILNDSLTEICGGAFEGCSSLTEIKIPGSVKELNGMTFFNCSNLTSIELSEGMTRIDPSAFWGCTNLSRLDVPSTVRDFTSDYTPGDGWQIPTTDLSIYFYGAKAPKFDTGLLYCKMEPSDGKVTIYYPQNATGWDAVQLQADVREAVSDGLLEFQTWKSPNVGPIRYTVSFDLSGGTGNVPSSTAYEVGTTVYMPSEIPVRRGYTFVGWSDGTTVYQPGQGVTVVDRNIEFVAVWKEPSLLKLDSYFSSAPNTSGSMKGARFVNTNVTPGNQNAFVRSLIQFSVPDNTPDQEIIINKLEKLLFQSKYRPQVFGGKTEEIQGWPIQNYDYNLYQQGKKTADKITQVLDSGLGIVDWSHKAGGCLAYGHFASQYVHGTTGTNSKQTSIDGEKIKTYFEEHIDPGETVSYDCSGNTHALVFLGENADRTGFYFISYGGGRTYKGNYRYDTIAVGFYTYVDFASCVSSWYRVWDTNSGSYYKGYNTSKRLAAIDANSDCPVEMIVYANGQALDSTGIEGTVSNQYVTIIATGSGQSRKVSAHIDYDQDVNYAIHLSGTDSGYMDFAVTYTDVDGEQDIRTFKNVPVNDSMVASTSYLSTRSTLELAVNYDELDDAQFWLANANETVTKPDEDYIPYNPGFGDDSSTPNVPTYPVYPSYPSTPSKPSTSTPSTKPEEPKQPAVPETPVQPEAPAEPAPAPLPFTDVASGAYYYDAVRWAVEQGVTTGTTDTTFGPDLPCSRAQAVTFLWRAAGSPAPQSGSASPFTDVPSGAYYYDAVLWAVEQGITAGTSGTEFSPDAVVTRGQIAVFLYRAAGSPAAGGVSAFDDVDGGAYYADAVRWAVAQGVTTGVSATAFRPEDPCTRAQIVTFLYRAK